MAPDYREKRSRTIGTMETLLGDPGTGLCGAE